MTARIASPETGSHHGPPAKPGILLDSPRLYDLSVRIFLLGRERAFRRKLLALARLRCGERVLDIGCGTGATAIEAKRHVGSGGAVFGIDASLRMIAQARRKAHRAGLELEFRQAPAQALPFPDSQFDVVVSTLMFHHLARSARAEVIAEGCRVLRPGGRLLVVDFEKSSARKPRWWAPHSRHGSIAAGEIMQLLVAEGLEVAESGPVGFKDLVFALATRAADR